MNKDVLVSITGTQLEYADVEEIADEIIEVINPATYFFKDGLHYVFYEEMQEGVRGTVHNKIVIKENEYLEVIKKGGVNTILRFEINKEHDTKYETPYGDLYLGITTTELTTTVEETTIKMQADYELAVNCETYAVCQIIVKINEKELGM